MKNEGGSMVTEEKQMTVCWHVDDLMVSCEDDFELTKFSCYLAKLYKYKTERGGSWRCT